ncbi:UTP-glucose-1-phosphate uridylyltransferase [Neolentinus lepideus HHB14362 ss-1]|uniref:UTP--glucose-1-phosphate uridylyltransferase n=1 Tax=Neolentinus lepideus HHB14362 ss-1 TaxID=1314782 RepID=A0A165N1Q5_9AGAM|nr:UTP-glucose-1-phosphate uridylyltransferase [Neolentinus lepideus HHB14362 ss-1]
MIQLSTILRFLRFRRRRKQGGGTKASANERKTGDVVSVGDGERSMRAEVKKLVATAADPGSRKAFEKEMKSFLSMYDRYLDEQSRHGQLDWSQIDTPSKEHVIPYDNLPQIHDPKILNKLAILKVNGGLGTSMGMSGAKSALEVKDGQTFLDLTIHQVSHLNATHCTDVPLLLMTSFNTHSDTLRIIKRHTSSRVRIVTFNQSRYPRVLSDTGLLLPQHADDEDRAKWYPPGHGDVYCALAQSGVLDQLVKEGREYLFVSNSDNLGAVADLSILQHMVDTQTEFIMEVTNKTKADMTGGTLIEYDNSLRLLEIVQVPPEYVEDFKSVSTFQIFNTNNLWINLKALKRIMDKGGMDLDIIVDPKVTDDGQSVIQLETAAGAAIKHFDHTLAIKVPRTRFLPVKNCSDLLLIMSDLYSLQNGQLVRNKARMFETMPVITLGDRFKKIQDFQKRFKKIPNILELDHLSVAGDVYFGRNVTLKGTVIVVANDGQRIDIPDGCTLENRLISGNFTMVDL